MLTAYLLPIRYAIVTFPILAFLFTLPFLIVQYRKYGYVNKFRVWVIYSLLLYLLTALYLVILPLPESRNTCTGLRETFVSLVPFQFWNDLVRETRIVPGDPSTYLLLLKERAFLQAAFNVLLLVPLGVFLRYYFRFGMAASVAAAFGLSLFFEITQVTGLYGIYACPYRLFDIDDLLLNTFGGTIGYVVAPLLTKIMPRAEKLDEHVDLKSKQVGLTRRFIALQLDAIVLLPLMALFLYNRNVWIYMAIFFAYFVLLPYMTNGRTFGKYMVRIRVKGDGERIRFIDLLIRYGILYGIVGGINAVLIGKAVQSLPPIAVAVCFVATVLVDLSFGVHVMMRLFGKNKTLFYEKWSGTKHEIV